MIYEDDLYEGDPLQPLWNIEISAGLPGEKAQELADALEDMAVSVFLRNREATDGDIWDIHLTVAGRPDEKELRRRLGATPFKTAPVADKDWLKAVHDDFPPLIAGRFFVYGSHYKGPLQQGLMPLQIDAATAFGSGEHETTRGCLEALGMLAKRHAFKNGLDMGCGSGILAIAMAKLWPGMKIAAVDIDPESTAVTLRHAALNNAALEAETGDGYNAALALENTPYDLIAANILAGPLIAMAPALEKALLPGGFCILSGLLKRQMREVAAAHEAVGLALAEERKIGEWEALVFRKAGPPG